MKGFVYTGGWNRWSVYWLIWAGVFFLGPEMYALFTNPSNTLSDQVWRLAGVGNGGGWSFAHFFVAAFCVWLCLHFIFGWFR